MHTPRLPPLRPPHDGLRALRRVLKAPRRYVSPWYLAYLLLGAVTAGLIPILFPLMIRRAAHDLSAVAFVMASYNLGLLLSPVWGTIAERRILYRPVGFAGLFFTAGATALMPFLHRLSEWLPCAFVIGAGSGAVVTVATLFIVDFAPRDEWEPRIGALQSFNAIGQVAGLLLAGLFATGSFSAGLWVGAAMLVPAFALGAIGLPPGSHPRARRPLVKRVREHLDIRALAVFPRLIFLSGIGLHVYHLNGSALRQLPAAVGTRFGRFLLSWFMFAFGIAAFFAYFPIMLADVYGIPAHVTSAVYALVAAVAIGVFVLTSRLIGRFGSGSVYRAGLWTRLGGFVLLLLPLVFPIRHSAGLALVAFALIVVAWPVLSVAGTAIAARLAPSGEGAALGLYNAALALATVIGTFVSGPLVRSLGYVVVPVLAIAGLLAAIFLELRLDSPSRRGGGRAVSKLRRSTGVSATREQDATPS
jgi:predicted MFS family arabinose efflux permease